MGMGAVCNRQPDLSPLPLLPFTRPCLFFSQFLFLIVQAFWGEYVTVIFRSKKYVGIIRCDDIVFPTQYSVIFIDMTSDVTLLAKS